MRVTFRQGIARYQTDVNATPTFLQKSPLNVQFVDLVVSPDPTIIIFAHKNATYVFEETKTVRNAWGPFTGPTTYYLYWDIDLLTAQITRGITIHPPIISGVAPVSPPTDQHWFDSLNTVMKVWNGVKWVEKIRVFAATYSSSAVIKPYPLGTQVGITGDFETGSIILDSFLNPLRQSDGSFVTSTTDMSVVGVGTRRVRFESDLVTLMANEYIPKNSLIHLQAGRKAILARSTDIMTRVDGIALEDMHAGETSIIVTGGLVKDNTWSWPVNSVNRPLFCGPTGELTLIPPTQGVLQRVGYVFDTDAIYIDIHPVVMLDDMNVPAPPPPPPPLSPVPDFTVVPFTTNGIAPFTVQFQDLTTNSPTSWEWDFTNDGEVDSTLQNPTYSYTTPGVYSVRLKVANGYGTNQVVKTSFITATTPPPTGTFTNLEINVGGPMQVDRNQLFTIVVTTRNTGFLTATNVVRKIEVLDLGGNQIPVSGLPVGSTTTRITTAPPRNVVTLPSVVSMASGSTMTSTFTVQAPPTGGNQSIRIIASVSSPEADVEEGDNSVSLYVMVV